MSISKYNILLINLNHCSLDNTGICYECLRANIMKLNIKGENMLKEKNYADAWHRTVLVIGSSITLSIFIRLILIAAIRMRI